MDYKQLLQQPEGRRLEFKASLPSKSDLSKTIIAFANDAGGVLLIGVKESPREISGLPEGDLLALEEKISNLIFDNCYPIISPEISILTIDEKFLIKVQVHRGGNVPYYLKSKGKNNGSYIRVGSSNRLATEDIIQEMERLKRNISFDSEPNLESHYADLNVDKLKTVYEQKTGEKLDDAALKKLHLLKKHQNTLKPTNALLLLCDGPVKSAIFPYAKIECGRFLGTTVDTFIDRKTLEGNLIEQVEMAYEFVLRHINQSAATEGVYTQTRW